jgi:hypothetical protein
VSDAREIHAVTHAGEMSILRNGDAMNVEVIPLTDFIHGDVKFFEGQPIDVEQGAAIDLEAAGLLRIKMSPGHANKMMPAPENKAGKAPAAGEDQPSSVSPAAPVSRPTTLHVSGVGKGSARKSGT